MAKTMVANIPGARLRDVERELEQARGEDAVNAIIAAHPNETKVLQHLVEWRRAGRSVPPLARVQRVMLWSDNSIELSAAAMPEAPARGGFGGPGGPRGRGGPPSRNAGRGAPPAGRSVPPSAVRQPRAAGGPDRPGASPPPAAGGGPRQRAPGGPERPGGVGRDRFGGRLGDRRGGPPAAPRPDGTRRYVFADGRDATPAESRPLGGRGGRPGARRGDRDGDERGTHGLPRAGEGWVLLREGEAPPPGPTLGGAAPEEAASTTAPGEAAAGTAVDPNRALHDPAATAETGGANGESAAPAASADGTTEAGREDEPSPESAAAPAATAGAGR